MEKTSFISLVIWLIAIRVTPMFFSFPEFDAPSSRDSWLALLLSTIPAVFGRVGRLAAMGALPGSALGPCD